MSASVPSIDDSLGPKLLPALLSMVAAGADAISLRLGGLVVAQITGNLIMLAAHLVTGAGVHVNALPSVSVFILALILTRLLVARLQPVGIESLRRSICASWPSTLRRTREQGGAVFRMTLPIMPTARRAAMPEEPAARA